LEGSKQPKDLCNRILLEYNQFIAEGKGILEKKDNDQFFLDAKPMTFEEYLNTHKDKTIGIPKALEFVNMGMKTGN